MENRRRYTEVTSLDSRVRLYIVAIIIVITILFRSASLWFYSDNISMLQKFVYATLSAATLPYVYLVVRCMWCRDVPVPSYRLGAKRRLVIYVLNTSFTYWVAYSIEDLNTMVGVLNVYLLVIVGAMVIIQLWSPAEDLDWDEIITVIALGALFSVLGWFAKDSLRAFIVCTTSFPVMMCTMHHVKPADVSWDRYHQSLLPVLAPPVIL